jgi:hypothetical protein
MSSSSKAFKVMKPVTKTALGSNLKPGYNRPIIISTEPTIQDIADANKEFNRYPEGKDKYLENIKEKNIRVITTKQRGIIPKGNYSKANRTWAQVVALPPLNVGNTNKSVKFAWKDNLDAISVTENELREYYRQQLSGPQQPDPLTIQRQIEQFDKVITPTTSSTRENQTVAAYLVEIISNKFLTGNLLLTSNNFSKKMAGFEKTFTQENVAWKNDVFSQRVLNFLKRIKNPQGQSYYDVLLSKIQTEAERCISCGDKCTGCVLTRTRDTLHNLTGLGGKTKRNKKGKSNKSKRNKRNKRSKKRRTLKK